MPIRSDLTIDVAKLQLEAVSESTKKANDHLMTLLDGEPKWFEVRAAEYREKRRKGQTPFPKRTVIESGEAFSIPSREKGRDIPCRIMMPENGGKPRGVYMHLHGGGWVLQSEADQDSLLKRIADGAYLAVISIGYRLAPEHPYPKPTEDCFDAGEWLVDNAQNRFGVGMKFLGGESAGGHLATLTAFHLLRSRPAFHFSGLVLNFGCYDLTFLPQAHHYCRSPPLMLDLEMMQHFIDAFCPGMSLEDRKKPAVSPFYQDLAGLELPPALFTCGTEDCLLDDTVMMAVRWQMAGAEGILRIFPGAPHGFILFDPAVIENVKAVDEAIKEFLEDKM